MTGWVKRRSTRTTTVLSCLSLTTTPCSVRFGISRLLRLGFRARGALLRRDRLDTRDVATDLPDTRGVLELPRRALEAQVEALLLEFQSLVVELVAGHGPKIIRLHGSPLNLLCDALDEARLDRQLGSGKRQRLARDHHRYPVDLEQDAPGLDAGNPEFRRTLARTHAHFERLLRYRHVRINADPYPARPLHVAGERAARGLDLARGDTLRLQGLESELAERKVYSRGREALDAALVRLAEFRPHRLQHGSSPFLSVDLDRSGCVATRTSRLAFRHFLVLRHRVVLHDLALEDPHLHAAGAIRRERRGHAVIDVGAQRVERHAAFAIPFHARDLAPAETSRAVDADAAGAKPHRRLDGALHRAAKGHAAVELLRDRLSDQLRIEFRLPDLDDVNHDVGLRQLGHFLAQLLDVGALLADDDARPRGLHSDTALLVRPLDHDLRDRRLLEILHQRRTNLHILVEQLPVLALAGVPARIPGAVDTEP